jgi:hypothetical protein
MWSAETQDGRAGPPGFQEPDPLISVHSFCLKCGQTVYEWTVAFLPPRADKSWNLFE